MAINTQTEATQRGPEQLDAHVRETVQWHFSPETGSPFWLDWAKRAGWNPAAEIQSCADLTRLPHFEDEWLRDEPNERWIPQPYQGRPFYVFETGGTTGMPKQRISWEDHLRDYEQFAETRDEEAFPRGQPFALRCRAYGTMVRTPCMIFVGRRCSEVKPMSEYRVEAVLTEDRTLIIKDLPFKAGDTVDVIVLPRPAASAGQHRYPLHGTPIRYDCATEPVAEEDWEATR
jgi:phenylacetate-coenzyme A ligase PaaK-like adenylate-forming protein